MTNQKRLSICFAAVGHDLLPSAGPTRNVLALAEALSQWATVSVAFRRVLEPVQSHAFDILEIDPTARRRGDQVDDAAVRGAGLGEFSAYLRSLNRFLDDRLPSFDVVLEKSWLLSGYLTVRCLRRGRPAAVVENLVRVWHEPCTRPKDYIRYAQHHVAQFLVKRYLRQAPLIIAETEELKKALVKQWRLADEQVRVVSLGVDPRVFYPQDQMSARAKLRIPPDATVLLYAGSLDRIHDLTPLLEAIRDLADSSVVLHIVGDGFLRTRFETIASPLGSRVVFHGRVSGDRVPLYIAAADLCVAPYNVDVFPAGELGYSTLKVREAMACARPVATVPSSVLRRLIEPGVNGFLVPNERASWRDFLHHCPSRRCLAEMGAHGIDRAVSYSWDTAAEAYFELCQSLTAIRRARPDDLKAESPLSSFEGERH